MAISPHVTAAIAFLALVPVGIYAVASGQLSPAATAIGVINILIIGSSLLVLFGLTEDDGADNAVTS